MLNINNTLKFFKKFFFGKELFLVNSALEYLCLVEWTFKNKYNKKNMCVVIGFTTNKSINQIRELDKTYFNYNNLFFLKDIFNEYIFRLIINVYKIFHVKKELVVVGDYKYYLNQPIYNRAKKFILLDEGISLTRLKNFDIKNKNYEIFSIFNFFKQEKLVLNKFHYLSKKLSPKEKIDKNLIFLLGTSAAEYNLITKKFYYEKIIKFSKLHYDKKIIFIPHREDKIFEEYLMPENITIKKMNKPIEVEIIFMETFPKIIAGFYSSALLNLSIILGSRAIDIINIAYDTTEYKDELIKGSFETVTKLPQFKSIEQLKI